MVRALIVDAALKEERRATYEREGWLYVPGLVDDRTLAALQQASVALEESARHFEQDTKAAAGVFFEVQSLSGRKKEPAVAPGVLRKITGPSRAQPAFAKLRRDPRVLAAARACGVANPKCVVDQINFKNARVGTGFPFHQDANFLHGAALADLAKYGGVHVVVALDASDVDNGGFTVLGRTHRDGVKDLAHHYDTSQMNEGVFNEEHRQVVPLAPGDGILFHPQLAHGSGPNPSDRGRRLATLWFVGGLPDSASRLR
ncbi:MAG: phytanoyl-CoA dioxygenase family protein [Deltaproteobacteria bacterium]|nr:phytanoyl-CoA dioxygenase family protein [Deltaproteobacteria bacterium]